MCLFIIMDKIKDKDKGKGKEKQNDYDDILWLTGC